MSREIAVFALIAYCAFVFSRVLQRRQIPELVGFLIAGALFGPSALGLLHESDLARLQPLTSVALAVLMFLLGERLTLRSLRTAPWALAGGLLSCAAAGAAVYAMCWALGTTSTTALVLAALAGAGAPMTVACVVRSAGAERPGASGLVGAHVVCDAFAAVAVAAALPLVEIVDDDVERTLTEALVQFSRFGLGAVALGVMLGLVVRRSTARSTGEGDLLVLVLVHVFVMVTLVALLEVSLPLSALAMGVTAASAPRRRHEPDAFRAVRPLEPVLYLVFFVLAGASVHLGDLAALGTVGAGYVGARIFGKVLGGLAGARLCGFDNAAGLRLGVDLLPQGGVAVALAVLASESLLTATDATTIVLGSVVLFELAGPVLVARHLGGDLSRPRERSPVGTETIGGSRPAPAGGPTVPAHVGDVSDTCAALGRPGLTAPVGSNRA